MRRATVFAALLLMLVALALAAHWLFNTSSAAPDGSLSCSVKPTCDVGEVEVLRMSSTSNAHAGTPSGSAYGHTVCCTTAGLGGECTGVHDVVLTLSGPDNAHVASDGSYAVEACLSVGDDATVDCTYGPTCGVDYACLVTISGSTNAHVADCDGADDYATKVCCLATADNCPTVPNPSQTNTDADLEAGGASVTGDADGDACDDDDDNDAFEDDVEVYLGTDLLDNCPDDPSDDAWPLDISMDKMLTVVLDALNFRGRIGATSGSPEWLQRLDFNMDGMLTVVGDALLYRGMIGETCT